MSLLQEWKRHACELCWGYIDENQRFQAREDGLKLGRHYARMIIQLEEEGRGSGTDHHSAYVEAFRNLAGEQGATPRADFLDGIADGLREGFGERTRGA